MFLLSITIPSNNTLDDKECQNITSQKGGSFVDCRGCRKNKKIIEGSENYRWRLIRSADKVS